MMCLLATGVQAALFDDLTNLVYDRIERMQQELSGLIKGMENVAFDDVTGESKLWAGPCIPPEPKSEVAKLNIVCPVQTLGSSIYYSGDIRLVQGCTKLKNPTIATPQTAPQFGSGFRTTNFATNFAGALMGLQTSQTDPCCVAHDLCYANCTFATGMTRAYQKELCDMQKFQCETGSCNASPSCMLRVIEQCRAFDNQIELMECTLQQSTICGGSTSCRFEAYSSLFFSTQLGCDAFESAQDAACAGCAMPAVNTET